MKFFRPVLCFLFPLFFFQTDTFSQSIIILFQKNSATISKEDSLKIENTVVSNREKNWVMEAKASSSGGTKHNRELSKRRALAVKNLLVNFDIKESNIEWKYTGENNANQEIDDANDRVVKLSFTHSAAPEGGQTDGPSKETSFKSVEIMLVDGLDNKKLSGTFTRIGSVSSYASGFSSTLFFADNTPIPIKIHVDGYHDTTVTILPDKKENRIALLPINVLEKMVVDNIYFYGNSAEIIPESFRALENLYRQLKEKKNVKIEIRGHINWPVWMESSPLLDVEHQALSEQRAKAVMDWLIKKGIPAEILSFKGFSNTQMLYPEAQTEGQMSFNRRVEIIVLKK